MDWRMVLALEWLGKKDISSFIQTCYSAYREENLYWTNYANRAVDQKFDLWIKLKDPYAVYSISKEQSIGSKLETVLNYSKSIGRVKTFVFERFSKDSEVEYDISRRVRRFFVLNDILEKEFEKILKCDDTIEHLIISKDYTSKIFQSVDIYPVLKFIREMGILSSVILDIALEIDPLSVIRATSSLARTYELELKAVNFDGRILQFCRHKTLEICEIAIRNGACLSSVPRDLKTYRICFESCRMNGNNLRFVPNNLLTFDICKAAVKSNPMSLRFVPFNLRLHRNFCEDVVKTCGFALKYVPELAKSLNLCSIAYDYCPLTCEFFPEHIRKLYKIQKNTNLLEDDFALNECLYVAIRNEYEKRYGEIMKYDFTWVLMILIEASNLIAQRIHKLGIEELIARNGDEKEIESEFPQLSWNGIEEALRHIFGIVDYSVNLYMLLDSLAFKDDHFHYDNMFTAKCCVFPLQIERMLYLLKNVLLSPDALFCCDLFLKRFIFDIFDEFRRLIGLGMEECDAIFRSVSNKVQGATLSKRVKDRLVEMIGNEINLS
jgi:hypothetical protein